MYIVDVAVFDVLDGDLITYDSVNGTPDDVCDQLAGLYLPDEFIDKVDEACSTLWGELPGAELNVEYAMYVANIKKV